MNREEAYRKFVYRKNLESFTVRVKETDIAVQADQNLYDLARESVLTHRGFIEAFIHSHPSFASSLIPWTSPIPAPRIVQDMIAAGNLANVGPMAAVAGAVAEHVGRDLLMHSDEVVIENGGDIFLKLNETVTVGIYAGHSPLSMKVGLRLISENHPIAICTSSGTIGHSISYGRSDAVCIVSRSCPLADAVATSIGNRIQTKSDIRTAVQIAGEIDGIIGAVAIIGDTIGFWGDLDIIPLTEAPAHGKRVEFSMVTE